MEEVELAREDVEEWRWDSARARLRRLPTSPVQASNLLLVEFAASRWRSLDEYRSGLQRLFPQLFEGGGSGNGTAPTPTQAYNAAVLAFHGGEWRRALGLIAGIPAPDTGGRRGALTAWAQAQLLAAEIKLSLGNPEDASAAIAALTSLLRRFKKSPKGAPPQLSRLHERIHAYKLRCLLAAKKTSEVAAAAATSAQGGPLKQPWKSLVLEAHLEQLRLSLKETQDTTAALAKVSEAGEFYPSGWGLINAGESATLVLSTARGCILAAKGSASLALLQFQRAAAEVSAGPRGRSSLFSAAHRLPLAYNLALASVRAGPADAGEAKGCLHSLLSLLSLFPRNPRLWLRLGETALVGHSLASPSQPKPAFVGVGVHRKLLHPPLHASPAATTAEASDGRPQLSPDFAAECLRNALALLPRETEAACLAQPGPPLTPSEVGRLRRSALAQLAYASLALGNFHAALSAATQLIPGRGGGEEDGLTTLARFYAAEAALELGQGQRAMSFLDFARVPSEAEPLRAAALANLALLNARLGNVTGASNALRLLPPAAANSPCLLPISAALPRSQNPQSSTRIHHVAPYP